MIHWKVLLLTTRSFAPSLIIEFQQPFNGSEIDLNRNFRSKDHFISEDFLFFYMTGRPFSNFQGKKKKENPSSGFISELEAGTPKLGWLSYFWALRISLLEVCESLVLSWFKSEPGTDSGLSWSQHLIPNKLQIQNLPSQSWVIFFFLSQQTVNASFPNSV